MCLCTHETFFSFYFATNLPPPSHFRAAFLWKKTTSAPAEDWGQHHSLLLSLSLFLPLCVCVWSCCRPINTTILGLQQWEKGRLANTSNTINVIARLLFLSNSVSERELVCIYIPDPDHWKTCPTSIRKWSNERENIEKVLTSAERCADLSVVVVFKNNTSINFIFFSFLR